MNGNVQDGDLKAEKTLILCKTRFSGLVSCEEILQAFKNGNAHVNQQLMGSKT